MKRGFTLIELLVVVLIIGILSAIALPQYTTVVAKSRAAEAIINLRHIYDAQQIYKLSNGNFTEKISELEFGLPVKITSELEIAVGNNFKFYCSSAGWFCQTTERPQNVPMFEIFLESKTLFCICENESICKVCKSSGGSFSHKNNNNDYYLIKF